MKRRLLARVTGLALLAPLAWTANAADPSVDVYAVLHLSLDHLDNRESDSQFLSTNQSRLGIRGSTALSADTRALFQYETEVNATEGGSGLFRRSRHSFLGLSGPYGTVRGGNLDGPLKALTDRTQFFTARLGDPGNLIAGAGVTWEDTIGAADAPGHLRRHSNAIDYTTPEWQGLSATLMGTPAQGESSAQTGSWMVRWQQPAFQLAAGCVHSRSGNFANGDRSQTTRQLLAQYREGAINLVAIVQDHQHISGRGDRDARAGLLGLGYRVAPGLELQGQVAHFDDDRGSDHDSTLYTVGVEHAMNPRARVYLNYAQVRNGDLAGRSVAGQSHAPPPGPDSSRSRMLEVADGNNQWGVSAGMLYVF
ncbi:porin [Alkalilimnicola ehrlichii MLHE-1]|uniref:Porin, Gram-negative type n=1 Tax=Alkalilimnicola ehrlichii (strain ATCC BAA-1101 / DSM 17681 / MLHE-1) TaxID=187272 RepID=Q0A9M1_ALKEH|nr:porin [Alkalilimnicola ehrlichii]ABI56466.1 porin, Gram-negative type [Alkalilimnicola ehrlichii MLHE-1]